jgi:hypothetical protein
MVVLRLDHAPRRIQTLRQKEEAIEDRDRDAARHSVHPRLLPTEPEEFVRTLCAIG